MRDLKRSTLHYSDRNFEISTLSIIVALIILGSSAFAQAYSTGGNSILLSTSSGAQAITVSAPIYVWFFGYQGNEFYPQTQLNISESTMVSIAENLSSTFGKQRLILVTAVNELPLPNLSINQSMVSTIASYITQLKQYASAVYGRLDFYEFNLTSMPTYGDCSLGGGSGPWYDCPIYNQSSLYINQLGLNGIWFDHPSQYYESGCTAGHCGVGPAEFNLVMQNLTTLLPNSTFIMNQTPGSLLGYVTQIQGDCGGECTWANQTYVAPSPPQKSLAMNQNSLETENGFFPGHVIGHFDAEGPPAIGSNPEEPMSIFADENSSQQLSAINALLYNATHPSQASETYSMVVPLVGSWTCDCVAYGTSGPNYNGTLYNGLTTGVDARSTLSGLEEAILNNLPPSTTIGATSDTVGKSVTVSGVDFLATTQIKVEFDGTVVARTTTNSIGAFSTLFKIPPASAGSHHVTVTDGYHTLSASFNIKPSITDKPSSGEKGNKITVSGNGFGDSLKVTVLFNGVQLATQPTTIETNTVGSFSATYSVPSLKAGSYTVTAKDSSGNIASSTFKVKT